MSSCIADLPRLSSRHENDSPPRSRLFASHASGAWCPLSPISITGKSVSSRESGDALHPLPCRTPLARRCLASSGSAGVLAREKKKAA